MPIDEWLHAIPPLLVYVLVGLIIGIESLGVPLPGEVTLISAALLSATGAVSPLGVTIGASTGAILGDSTGYYIGHKGGRPLIARLGRRFPKHLGPEQISKAERMFHRSGFLAVFFGRWIAILRILAGPLAGAFRMRYPLFLVANAGGGILWAGCTTVVIFYLGKAAEVWLGRFRWLALIAAVAIGLIAMAVVKRRVHRNAQAATEQPTADAAPDPIVDNPSDSG